MNKYALRVAAVLATVPLALAGCSSAGDESPSASPSSSADDRGGTNNSAASNAGFETFTTQSEAGTNFMDIVGSGYPDTIEGCSKSGTNLVTVVNFSSEDQSFQLTDGTDLANEIQFIPPSQLAGGASCAQGGAVDDTNVTVPAGGAVAVGLIAGGHQGPNTSISGAGKNLVFGAGLGGKNNNTAYNLVLNENIDQSFNNWKMQYYKNTGGMDPSVNTQSGLFNGIQCTVGDNNGQVSWDTGDPDTIAAIITPQISINGAAVAGTYESNDPICFGFFDEGASVGLIMPPGTVKK